MNVQFLKKVSFLNELSSKNLSLLSKIAKKSFHRKGEQIFSAATSGDKLYIVTQGRVKIFSTSPAGKLKVLDYLEKGDFFGEMSLFDEDIRSASACAVDDSHLIIIPKKDFQKLLKNQPELTISFLKVVCNRLRRADKEIESLTFQNVLGRLAIILLDFAERYGQETEKGIILNIDITHQELAHLAGTAREMITRIMTRFKKTDCLIYDEESKRITIINKEKLKGFIY